MKRSIIIISCIIAAAAISRCKKSSDNSSHPVATCTTCNNTLLSHAIDADGFYYYLPTAFTPNGDGINDMFRMVYDKVVVDSSTITVWDLKGNGVFVGTINQGWDGNDLTGHRVPAGSYPLYLKLRKNTGETITSCGCVTILAYKGSCIYTGGNTFYLNDQLDGSNGFVFATNENICP